MTSRISLATHALFVSIRRLSSKAAFPLAFLYIATEGSCAAQAASYPPVMNVSDGSMVVGSIIGTWLSAIPFAIAMVIAQALTLQPYYRGLVRVLRPTMEEADECKYPTNDGRTWGRSLLPLFGTRALAMCAVGAATFAGMMPGMMIMAFGHESAIVATVGLFLSISGGVFAYSWVRLLVFFIERHLVLDNVGVFEAFRRSVERAQAARTRIAGLFLGAWLIEIVGAMGFLLPAIAHAETGGWTVWLVLLGFVTHPFARVLGDLWITAEFLSWQRVRQPAPVPKPTTAATA